MTIFSLERSFAVEVACIVNNIKSQALDKSVLSCNVQQTFHSDNPEEMKIKKETCDSNCKIQIESLNFRLTTKHLPKGIGRNFPNLLALVCSNTGLTQIERKDFFGLSALSVLRLSKNQITSIVLDVFKHSEYLEIIYLDSNQISSIDDGAFNSLTHLQELHLQNNNLRYINYDIYSVMKNLVVFKLDGNPIFTQEPIKLLELLLKLNEKNLNATRKCYKRKTNLTMEMESLRNERLTPNGNKTTSSPTDFPSNTESQGNSFSPYETLLIFFVKMEKKDCIIWVLGYFTTDVCLALLYILCVRIEVLE